MKIAITGKGGAGKSTLAAMICRLASADGHDVLAVDSDPDANLAFSLGIPAEVRKEMIPVAQQTGLIEERTGAKLKKFGQIFRLNPDVSDVAEKLGYHHQGVNLIVMGAIQSAGSGCACPENVFLKNLLTDIMIRRNEYVIVDMEAGIEHLGRGTARGVDTMIIVVEPAPQSVETANSIIKLAGQLDISEVRFTANKTRKDAEIDYLYDRLDRMKFLGTIPYSEEIVHCERKELPLFENISEGLMDAYQKIYAGISELT